MNQLKHVSLLAFALIVLFSNTHAQQLQIKWNFADTYDGNKNLDLTLNLINIDNKSLDLSLYELWFTSLYPIEGFENNPIKFHNRNGNLYSISFPKGTHLKAQDSLLIHYKSPYPITHTSLTPNGFYLQGAKNPKKLISVGHPEVIPLQLPQEEQNKFLSELYSKNSILEKGKAQLILPTPAELQENTGTLTLSGQVTYYLASAFESEINNFQIFASQLHQLQFLEGDEKNAKIKVLHLPDLGNEEYKLNIDGHGIRIEASTGTGAFYALQTLRSILHKDQLTGHADINLPYLRIQDKPRFGYRGFMMDIARNFKSPQVIKKYLDLLASMKINKFHLHFIDDEGWRLEIPSLPELTEVGSVRSPFFKDGNSIQPAYGSGSNQTDGAFLSKAEFQDILEYAAQRHISVIPEIETPGHGRAAIKAMETRYHRLMKEGKKKEAEEFLLYEAADKSEYSSAQYWNDNVMNPALPSVYHFIDVVVSDIQKMYTEVGLKLETISLGGDEVPAGSWEKSPLIKALMIKEGMSSVYDVWPYYVKKIYAICQQRGVEMAGWEEFGMVNKGKGMVVNEDVAHLPIQLDVWNNVIGGGQEDLAYKLANAGYKTVFTSCANFYFDMVWDKDFREPGLKWASITDLQHAYSLLPEAFFANMAYTNAGKSLKPEYIAAKVRLTEKGKSNLAGLKAALWAETILTSERMDYMLLPRLYALAERAWSPERSWENDQSFNQQQYLASYSAFAHKVSEVELPKLALIGDGFNYRLPAVGVIHKNGILHANTEYPGFQIYYSIGSDRPEDINKAFPKDGLKIDSGTTIYLAVKDENGRIGRISRFGN